MELKILVTKPQPDYDLIDSGEGMKLERYGPVVVARPDPQALWPKRLGEEEWKKAHAEFRRGTLSAKWAKKSGTPDRWEIGFGGLRFGIELTPFKHTGLFPEQLLNWEWIRAKIADAGRPVKILNLFGYTGGATLAAAAAGAEVTHVDASKASIGWAKENAKISGLAEKPIRWILDDAFKFVEREARRGNAYDGIVMDPPSYGKGAKGETWKIEEKLLPLLKATGKILSNEPIFLLVNGYASGYSALAYRNDIESILAEKEGFIEAGELAIEERNSERLLPAGIFARWSK